MFTKITLKSETLVSKHILLKTKKIAKYKVLILSHFLCQL